MNDVTDFLSAALPWICIGLLLAIVSAQNFRKGKKKETYSSEGLALGMCLGTAVGTALGNNIAIGLPLGTLIGFIIGSLIEKENDDDKK